MGLLRQMRSLEMVEANSGEGNQKYGKKEIKSMVWKQKGYKKQEVVTGHGNKEHQAGSTS